MSLKSRRVFTFTWKITNFSLNQFQMGKYFKSVVIRIKSFKDTEWYLTLYPKGVDEASSGFISCFLNITKECQENEFSSSYTLEIIDPNGNILATTNMTEFDKRKKGRYEFLEIEELNNAMENWRNDVLEIRCKLYSENYCGNSVICEAHTEVQMQKYLFDWKILIPKLPEWTKEVKCEFEKGTPIDITLTAPGEKIHFNIKKSKEQQGTNVYKLKISVCTLDGCVINWKNSTFLFPSEGYETSFEKSQLQDETSFIHLFKLLCAIYVSSGVSTSTFLSYSYEDTSGEGLEQLAITRLPLHSDLQKLFLGKKHCDVKLKTENEIIPAHKCLLSARSPVFSAMFDQDMVETLSGIVDIPDVESETLKSFIEFLYTDSFNNTDEDHVLKLILVADKYQVSKLKDVCSQILMSKLSLKNVYKVISVADMVNQVGLKEFAFNFTKTNKNQILLSTDWSEWAEKNMKLATEILTKLSID